MDEVNGMTDPPSPRVKTEIAIEASQDIIDAVRTLTPELGSKNQVEVTPDYLRELIRSDSTLLLIARNTANQISGLAILVVFKTLINPRALIETIVVDPQVRRQGIARALVERALYEANKRKVNTVRVSTGNNNTASNELFKSMGGTLSEDYVWYDFDLGQGPRD